ncbi:Inactive hydroxysteroid dehydrogenase-like protein 1 [Blattella germanica]|nr:Inactive hydroxysteroid dehydrogenase-like protein 1 [Blattella germanica]
MRKYILLFLFSVVTGSTDGIGKAYALELAKRGVNIVLISRTQSKLDAVAFEIVNNVGKQYAYPMYLGEVPEQELWDIVNINIGATTMMTRLILPQMQARRQGAIINVSSGSELQPLPLMTVYAASKVFVRSFSEALRYEYQRDGITIQHLSPLFVNTKMNAFSHRLQETSLFVPNATTYARNAVNTLGRVNATTGYWAHGLQYFITDIPPVWVRTYIGGLMNELFRRDYFKGIPKE